MGLIHDNEAEELLLDGLERKDIFSGRTSYPRPDFTYSDEYKELNKSLQGKALTRKKAAELMSIKRNGTISQKRKSEIIEKARQMSLSQILENCSKYEKAVQKCEQEYDKLTVSMDGGSFDFEEYEEKRNKILIERYENVVYYSSFNMALREYIQANDQLIREEIVNAKRDEIRTSLIPLVKYLSE